MKYWYYAELGQQKGPIAENEFKTLIESGVISATTLVWTDGMKEWQLAGTVENLVTPTFAPAPPPLGRAAESTTGSPLNAPGTCLLCGNGKHMSKAKPLYGHMVCRKCYFGFANQRQLAYFLDLLVYYALCFVAAILVGTVMGLAGFSQSAIQGVGSLLGWLILPVLFIKDCFSGQSVGKAICGVKVIDKITGEPGSMGASFKRNLPLMIPLMPFIVASQLCKGHRTGDGWANTKVIWKKYASHSIFAPEQPQK